MDDITIAALEALGWCLSVGRDSKGSPYWAFTRGADYFHVTASSRQRLVDETVEYGNEGRRAKTVRLSVEASS